MGYIETILEPDERILQRARLHWVIYILGIALLLGGLLMTLVASNTGADTVGQIGFGLLFIAPLALLGAWITRVTTEIAVTDQRVIVKRGIDSDTRLKK